MHLRIRRLSVDAGVDGTAALDASELQTAIQGAIAAHLGGASVSVRSAPEAPPSLIRSVADAVAADVGPSVTRASTRQGGDRG